MRSDINTIKIKIIIGIADLYQSITTLGKGDSAKDAKSMWALQDNMGTYIVYLSLVAASWSPKYTPPSAKHESTDIYMPYWSMKTRGNALESIQGEIFRQSS
jgi:hypothetical protein